MPETVNCPLCGKSRSRFLYKSQPLWPVPPRDKSLHGHHWNRCLGCGLVYLSPRLTDDELQTILRRDAGDLEGDFLFDSERGWEYLKKRKFLEKHIPGGRLLDVGCGFGLFQKSLGPHWQAEGIETDEDAAGIGQSRLGVDIRKGSFERGEGEARAYDAVTCWDTLDHVADPVAILKQAHTVLRPGGVLCLSTADASATIPRLAGTHWRYLQTPDHRFAFTRAWLRKALATAGFHKVSTETYNRGPDFFFPFLEQCAREVIRAMKIIPKRKHDTWNRFERRAPFVPMFHDIILMAALKK